VLITFLGGQHVHGAGVGNGRQMHGRHATMAPANMAARRRFFQLALTRRRPSNTIWTLPTQPKTSYLLSMGRDMLCRIWGSTNVHYTIWSTHL